MKNLFAVMMLLISVNIAAQKVDFKVRNISLPSEISYYDNQFSGLYIKDKNLFFMSESRLQDNAEAKLYSIKLTDIERQLVDSNYVLPFTKCRIYNLNILRGKMKDKGDDYEGLEAMIIDKEQVYFSVETATPSNNCYLLRGAINDTVVVLDIDNFVPLKKPTASDGKHIYNAGFEAIAPIDNNVAAFFEFNYFTNYNLVNYINVWSFQSGKSHSFNIARLPFRITDITKTKGNKFTAINYFYKGEGGDEIYRLPDENDKNNRLIKDTFGYKNYCRLVKIKYDHNSFSWQPLWEFPKEYRSYNWEGIAAYKKGYFVVNDKYTPARPYKSLLLYLMFTK
ncbi:MAG: hypothetical protein ACKVOM_13750 [Ferruginibacter sp.]